MPQQPEGLQGRQAAQERELLLALCEQEFRAVSVAVAVAEVSLERQEEIVIESLAEEQAFEAMQAE